MAILRLCLVVLWIIRLKFLKWAVFFVKDWKKVASFVRKLYCGIFRRGVLVSSAPF